MKRPVVYSYLVKNIALDASQYDSRSQGGVLRTRLNKIAGQTVAMYNLPKSQFILDVSIYSLQPNSSVDSRQQIVEANEMNTRFLSKSRRIEKHSKKTHRC